MIFIINFILINIKFNLFPILFFNFNKQSLNNKLEIKFF